MSWLQLKGVTRRFGKVEVLSSIDLSLGADEMLVVLGPSGCGKTTTLRMVAGLEKPTAGQIVLAGTESPIAHPLSETWGLRFSFTHSIHT